MSNEIVQTGNNAVMTAKDLRAQVNLIQEVMKSVMQDKVHYGIIPGCPKPSLYKAGAEKIAVTFRIAVKTEVENLSTDDYAKFRVTASAYSSSGVFLGSATGVCSSLEEKYKWKKPVCIEEFDETPENRKREKWFKGSFGKSPYKAMQIRTEPADIENTVLQMADKRAYVAVVRKVTAASDVFTQDIEDLPEGVPAEDVTDNQEPEMPRTKQEATNLKQTKQTAQENLTHMCSKCGVGITQKVHDYSTKNKGAALCYKCQKG